jgi:hypothetical protein
MLRHPAKVSADTYDQVADHVSSINRVITYTENNKWTKDEVVQVAQAIWYISVFVLLCGIAGGME